MNIIEEVRHEREDLARVLKKHMGIRKIVEDLYPDSAHFIYELLQNAEDTGATETKFTLTKTGLVFEHNGRPFSPRDIYAITDIGEGTKGTNDDTIGRFGIGFKAVFAYTETPRIWSPTFAFEISELVLPSELPAKSKLDHVTHFEFPFNNPKKPASDAYAESEEGLKQLSETTLLFLSHIESIAWALPGKSTGKVLRIRHSDHHIEVLKQIDGKRTSSSHYLRFTELLKGFANQRIAIAFALNFLPETDGYDDTRPLADQFRIVPANPGRVAVFFSAEKESSGLRFHLHAPFVPELSRASIKETPANEPLLLQLADFTATSLHAIRKLKLLNADFLAVLPNPRDDIPDRYDRIRTAIISEMNDKPLTPTNFRGHAPARLLLQAKASLKKLLSAQDLEFLVDFDNKPRKWAVSAIPNNSNADRFLVGLAISRWDIEEFVEVLVDKARVKRRFDSRINKWVKGPDNELLLWLSAKPEAWHQKFYALLYRELASDNKIARVKDLGIIRLCSSEYQVGSNCYFPTDDNEHDDMLPRVSKGVYTSGRSKADKKNARDFLEEIGVREVGEADQVEVLLKQRYGQDNFKPNINDLKRFIALVQTESLHSRLFKDFKIFKCVDRKWRQPSCVYLDVPYLDTGLSTYYKALRRRYVSASKRSRIRGDHLGGTSTNGSQELSKWGDIGSLSSTYLEGNISKETLVEFARKVGVHTELTIDQRSCYENPDADNLIYRTGSKSAFRIDKDYMIEGLDVLLKRSNESISRLVWQTLAKEKNLEWTKAEYRNNATQPLREAPSRLTVLLRNSRWVPQTGKSSVCPSEAAHELLPEGFPFDPNWAWLKAIHFGEELEKQSAEHRRKHEVAIELGFNDEESLNDAKWFAQLDPEERKKLKAKHLRSYRTELPEHEPRNPDRRATRVGGQAADAPERRTEKRTRSVSVGREAVKYDTVSYLRHQYTNRDGETICQACKAVLPFKLADGNYYLEAVEFLSKFRKRHYQNYLALCPNHAAMFRHANGTKGLMKEQFLELANNELGVVLAEENTTLYFTKTHISDLKAIIEVEQYDVGGEESGQSHQ